MPGAAAVWVWTASATLFLTLLWRLRKSRTQCCSLPLPPGPSPLPIIGNLMDVPTQNIVERFRDLNQKYGDVVYLDALGQPMIVLGTHEAAVELLEKRSANYSDRNTSTMAQLCGLSWVLTLLNYGSYWRRQRRMFHQFFNQSAILGYQTSQCLEARRLALRCIDDPANFVHHIRHMFGSTIMRIAFGIEVDDGNEMYLTIAEKALAIFSAAFVPGKYLVETFPVLRYVPSWMPGAGFKREAEGWLPATREVLQRPWDAAITAIKSGGAPPSMAATLWDQISRLPPADAQDEEEIARQTTTVVYGAGADTTLSTVQTFFLALATNPEVQKIAQTELDAVVGPNRLPEFSDQASLPYVCAVIKELLRWRSVVPMGIPHRALKDDEYRGYFIPKGSIVVSNIWAYSRDPTVYPNPEMFRPERFLKEGKMDPNIRDPASIAFGYGRRICPGRHFAETSLFMIVSTVLHTLSVTAPLGEDGKPVHLDGKMTQGLLSYPEPFNCVIKPRSPRAESLIRTSCSEQMSMLGNECESMSKSLNI